MKITKKQALRAGNRLNINFDVIDIDYFRRAIEVELEHGDKYGAFLNVINNSITKAAKIATAHILEFPNYYHALEGMEKKLKKQWKGRRKPSIFN